MQAEDQSDVIALLADPATHGGGEVEHAETHISHAFLVGERVYKLKKAVQLPYLDFSTRAARQSYCEREVAINSRTAPELYIGVIPVTREADGAVMLDGHGEAVDWVVAMRRFDQATLFDRMARRDALSEGLMEQTAEMIARFHGEAEETPDFGGAGAIADTIANNDTVFAGIDPAIIPRDRSEALTAAQNRALEGVRDLLERRRHGGRVRRCHGDLHLRNICLIEDRPALFDAIEFDENLACIDVLYDLAFLLMDLDEHDLPVLAATAFNRYLQITDDLEGLAALPLFMSLRAAIRGHIAGMSEKAEEAGTYMERAERYLEPEPPRLVAVGGLSGSGKSRAARSLAPWVGRPPGALVLRSDVLRKRLWGVAPTDTLPAEAYTPEHTRRTYDALYDGARRGLAAGWTVVTDAVFARPDERQTVEAIAAEAGVPFDGLWLEAPADVMAERAGTRTGNACDAGTDPSRCWTTACLLG